MSVTGFLVNGQVQKYDYESLDNLPDDTGAGSFPVIYNITTASEITQALNKNQIPILKDPTTGSLYYLNSSAELNGDRIYIFVSNQGNKMRQVEVVGNTWGSFSDTILALNTSPTFQGVPKAPTAPTGTNNTQLATTAFVYQEIMYGALSEDLKQALLQIASKVVYIDADGQTYYNDLENALYPHDLLGIEATFTQGPTIIYDTDSLNNLKQYLTVVAIYSGGDTETLSDSDYTLSGNLLSGVSEITVEYEGFTDTFDVVVTHRAGYYTIVNNLTGCTTNNSATSIQENTTYTATITASAGYTLSGATATITMGGNILTGVFSNGTISIPSVTGDLVITVVASAITVSSISAVYTQSGTVYDIDTLDSLKTDLVVTATYSDSSTQTVPAADYTLSGTLTEGTSTITVSYGGKTATFNVTVTEVLSGYTTVGNPTIDSSYRMTTSDGNFIKTTFNFDNNGKPWEIRGKFHCDSTNQPDGGAYFYDLVNFVDNSNVSTRGILVELNMSGSAQQPTYKYKLNPFISTGVSSWDIVNPATTNDSIMIRDLYGGDVFFKTGWTGTAYYIAASADGTTWDSQYYYEWQNQTGMMTGYPLAFGNKRNIAWGYCIYVNSLELDIDGAPYWRAVKGA